MILLKNARFIKAPGYINDLFFIFILNFNRNYCQLNYVNHNKTTSDMRHYDKVAEEFEPISEDLFLFFYLNLNSYPQSLMTTFYYLPYKENFFDGSYSLTMIQNELLKYDQVIDNVLKYYFKDASYDTLKKCKESLAIANAMIRESGYEDRVKSALYSFLIDPIPIIQRLSHELMMKEFLLSKQYEKHYPDLIALQEEFDYDDVSNRLKSCCLCSNDIHGFSEIFVSFCYNNKNHIRVLYYKDITLLVLGFDYADTMQYLSDINKVPKLHEFGTAISEKNRVAILQLIYDKTEISIKEIEQTLDMAGTNAYYHISLLIRTGMLRTRNQGRTILYSINHRYFDVLSKIIKTYSKEKEE